MKKMKVSLKFKLTVMIIAIVAAALIFQGSITLKQTRDSLTESVNKYISAVTSDVANQIGAANQKEFAALKSYANMSVIKDENTSMWDKQQILYEAVARMGSRYENIGYLDAKGMNYTRDGRLVDLSGREYFQRAIKGEDFLVDPYYSEIAKRTFTTYAVPIKQDDGRITGVLIMHVIGNAVEELCKTIDIGQGYAPSVLNIRTGQTIANPNQSESEQKTSEQDNIELKNTIESLLQGKTGVSTFTDPASKNKMISAYAPVPGLDWSVFCVAPYNFYFATLISSSYFVIFMLIGSLIFSSVISILFTSAMIRPLIKVRNVIQEIASGNADLTRRLKVTSTDEIGDVCTGFNQFTEKMQAIMSDLKNSKHTLTETGSDLKASIDDTSTSIGQIVGNIDSISEQIHLQSESVKQTVGAVNEIASNIESLDRMIDGQGHSVSEASAAVEQMIGNISSVSTSIEKMAGSFRQLYENAQSGLNLQNNVNEKIQIIKDQSDSLKEANIAIASISEQTNLLAMNAAIEAAHAGEAGKGFSVVADEIRKLSETSAGQSKTIGDQLNSITSLIENCVDASNESNQAFISVSEKIKTTDELVRQIKSAMEEQNEGSKQINNALHSMNDSTVEVRNASKEMAEGNKAILEEVKNLQSATSHMEGSVTKVSDSTRKMDETKNALTELSDSMTESITDIGSQIDLFKV